MGEIPPIDSIASAALAVGAIFLLRYFLVLYRVKQAGGTPPTLSFNGHRAVFRAHAFGADHEPERRYAARQLALGIGCAFLGLGLFAWMLAGPFLLAV